MLDSPGEVLQVVSKVLEPVLHWLEPALIGRQLPLRRRARDTAHHVIERRAFRHLQPL